MHRISGISGTVTKDLTFVLSVSQDEKSKTETVFKEIIVERLRTS